VNERASVSPRVVFIGLGVSLVLSCLFALFVYYRFIRYQPIAERLLPQDAYLTVGISVEQGVVYQPFRDHFFPLLEMGREGPEPRLKHLERKTTLELGVDTRELAFAIGPGESWVIVLGGLFRKDGVLRGVSQMLEEEGRPPVSKVSASEAQIGPGAYFSLAYPGVLALGSSPSPILTSPVAEEGSSRQAVRVRVFPSALGRDQAKRTPILVGDVLLERDFPFVIRATADNRLALDSESLTARLVEACVEDRPALVLALQKAHLEEGGGALVGRLGRAGFDQLLAEMAAQLEKRAALSFDP
jgi:hypothetical protein